MQDCIGGIPQEVLDAVIDELADDRAALKSCCLASRRWVRRSQHHLFKEVRFSSLLGLKSLRNWSTIMGLNGKDHPAGHVLVAQMSPQARLPLLLDPFVCRNVVTRGSLPQPWFNISTTSDRSTGLKA
jgi:hypothetical protein